jgi:hypothetical protein
MDECRTRINADGDAECFGRARLFRLGSVRGDAPDATQADRDSQRDQLALTAYGAQQALSRGGARVSNAPKPVIDLPRRYEAGIDPFETFMSAPRGEPSRPKADDQVPRACV